MLLPAFPIMCFNCPRVFALQDPGFGGSAFGPEFGSTGFRARISGRRFSARVSGCRPSRSFNCSRAPCRFQKTASAEVVSENSVSRRSSSASVDLVPSICRFGPYNLSIWYLQFECLRFRAWVSGFRRQGPGFRAQGLGFHGDRG